MKFLTLEETRQWCTFRGIELDSDSHPKAVHAPENCVRMSLVNDIPRTIWFANFIERTLMPRDRCLLWLTQVGVWPTSKNWHLYYRIRELRGSPPARGSAGTLVPGL